MAGNVANKTQCVSTFAPLGYTSDVNYFRTQPYAIKNVTHRERQVIPPNRVGQQVGDTVEYEIPKVVDYFGRLQHEVKFNGWSQAALNALAPGKTANGNDPQFIEGLGYRLIDNVTVNFTNKRLNSSQVPFWWTILLDAFCRDYAYNQYIGANQSVGAPNTGTVTGYTRHTQLVNGYTVLSEIETGFQHHSRENYVMISVLSSRIVVKVKLAPIQSIVQGFISGAITIGDAPQPWIPNGGCNLIVNAIHLNPNERKRELEDHDSGVFSLIRTFDTQTDVVPAGSTNFTIDLKFTGCYEVLFLIFKPTFQTLENGGYGNDPTSFFSADAANPISSVTALPNYGAPLAAVAISQSYTIPTYAFTGGSGNFISNTGYAMPSSWEFLFQNTPFFPKERCWINLTIDRQHHFPGMVKAPNAVLALLHSETFNHDNNAILGHLDYNTASKRQIKLYWETPGVTSSAAIAGLPAGYTSIVGSGTVAGAPDTMTITTVACGPDFMETVQGQIHSIFNN